MDRFAPDANDALRWGLVLAGLGALAAWGRSAAPSGPAAVAGMLPPVLAAATWLVFRVDRKPGIAPVVVSGRSRLAIELGYFAAAVAALVAVGRPALAAALGGLVLVHYTVARDRVREWLDRPSG